MGRPGTCAALGLAIYRVPGPGVCVLSGLEPLVTVSQSQAPPSGFRAAHLKEGMEFKMESTCGALPPPLRNDVQWL